MRLLGLATLALVAAGCQAPQLALRPQVPAPPPANPAPAASPDYPVVFPDVLEISVPGNPECTGRRLVYPDGRIDLGRHGAVLAEGCTAAEITRRIADAAGVLPQQVQCRVAAARSRFVYVVGAGADHPRAIPYTGPQPVTELFERVHRLAPDVHASEIRVVRRNVARGIPTETFKVDLAAVRNGDGRTDVILEPNDEIHVAGDRGVIVAAFRSERPRP
jgi:polysaccharide biosynthesis/export protein